LKQLWILSEAKEDNAERKSSVEKRLEVGDVAKELNRILRKEDEMEMKEVNGDDNPMQDGQDDEVIQID